MRLYPAIDIRDGQCVRLKQGVFQDVTIYAKEPFRVAMAFEEQGAEFIHLVDLDGALCGKGANTEAIRQIVQNVRIPLEIGGGIRSLKEIEEKLAMGISRVILGTKAVENPEFVKDALYHFGAEKIVIGIDAKDGRVATNGWEKVCELNAVDFALQMKAMGVKTVIYTDIATDGMLCGPNFEQTETMVKVTGLDIVASGGVSCMEDLIKLEKLGVEGAVLGKAIYEKKIELKEAVLKFAGAI